jgi:hypothetical protein
MGYEQYGVADATFRLIMLLSAFGALALLVAVVTDTAMPGPTKIVVLVAGLPAVFAMPVWARVAETVTTPEGVVVRGFRRTRTFAWSDIQDIRIEHNPGGYLDDRGPRHIAVLYDGTGHRVPLPHVNEKNLDRLRLAFATEVEAMRTAWQQGRGADWAPVPLVQRKVAERVRYQFTSLAVGLFAAFLAAPVVTLIFVVGLFAHASELPSPWSWPFQPAAIMVVPAIVFPTVAIASKLARRRARRTAVS